ncbi:MULTISPECIES: enoyl-ACP reductase FabV [Pseudidiomarina]|uniref:Enoyl-[acyl-carrier-protein] reductase [NADH] n=2 Tax=Pseudidiomarina TaxID=2800384 RepID=A0A368V3Y9_9GAMM|nr:MULTISPECIES: enoyl-ACP reductase FabV [Pseudidiomarina]PWW16148.1 enoyl-[acyl-carrier protein] reductase/trans-2-enoyl-CoA reductase (NAD+) [Pseudidiomarina maritima]RBP93342.1 enoyl-[acyl-carrier protein] reductase/trans-2-enoyl-CoA reductase (NAD+) [Pseudidiomarina tainanensis]RCW35802.1 enoyl-[acyl-carrier protein] reductase/trans-2-enoyl-CoA reductase (NAD+) [Pseudidiomarina tainanensis]
MIIQPKIRGFICTNAHPVGCAAHVQQQIDFIKQQPKLTQVPQRVLVIGCSTGYGLASRIAAAYGAGAKTLGVCFEKEPSEKRTATAGWYNTAAFHQAAKADGLYAHTINGDAFSNEIKAQVIEQIKQDFGQVDLVIYSLASPKRKDPVTGEVYSSTLKPIGDSYTTKTYHTDKDQVTEITLDPATDDEIAQTIKVMGGEDWELWLAALHDAGVLAPNAKTTAYTYIGKKLTWPIYGQATIGKAKEDLDRAAAAMRTRYTDLNLEAYVSSLKALVTQASSAIPVMPLYISLIYGVMKQEGTHEGCIEQIYRLFNEALYSEDRLLDEAGRLFMNGWETNDATQAKVEALWHQVNQENFHQLADYAGYHSDFLKLFGFGIDGVDYDADVDPMVGFD